MAFFKNLSCIWILFQPYLIHSASCSFGNIFEQKLRSQAALYPLQNGDQVDTAFSNDTSGFRYYNAKTAPYFIKSWPNVTFDTGEIYGGSVSIKQSDPSRTLYFVFKPAQNAPVNEITIWLNGGPGCSSLEGFLQENGPISWRPGTAAPVENPYAWSTLTNMLWVDQPVGAGFSQGKVTARNEVDVAEDFLGFFQNWQVLFGIENYKIYVTGESYAGRFVPYIGAQMLDRNDTTHFDLAGEIVYDPWIGDGSFVQGIYPTYQFVLNNNEIMNYNQTTMDVFEQMSSRCGYTAYLDKYLQFPPPGTQPVSPDNYPEGDCDILKPWNEAHMVNRCFDVYHISNYCPKLWSVIGEHPYFNRIDVKEAIHAPLNVTWQGCNERAVFVGRDRSLDPIQGVLPQVIEATNRVLVSNGDWDGLLLTNGTLLSVQNMTWNGKLGFQSAPSEDFVVPSQGVIGKKHWERGLQWVETYQCGHMQPQYQPKAALRHLEWLLGRIDEL